MKRLIIKSAHGKYTKGMDTMCNIFLISMHSICFVKWGPLCDAVSIKPGLIHHYLHNKIHVPS